VSLKKEMESKLSLKPKMSLAMGELKILVNGEPIFSYKEQKRMPRPGEIVGLIESSRKAAF
jgi:hypothetical protein